MSAEHDTRSRRDFIRHSATGVSAGVVAGIAMPRAVHAGGSDILKIGLVGCGGRGQGAVENALAADPQTKLTAVGDAFADRAHQCLQFLRDNPRLSERIDVDQEHTFVGFDAYRQVIDSGVDVVLLASVPHFRPRHFRYAIEAGKHVFIEKPIAVDASGVRDVLATSELAREQRLSVVSGLCWRYDARVRESVERIREGQIGDIVAIESMYNSGTLWHRGDQPAWSRMEYQLRNWLYFTWLSGDHIVEQAVHSLDKSAWLLGDVSPVRAMASGGRQQRIASKYGNVFDHFAVFYEFPSGQRVYFSCRQQDGCSHHVDETVLASKGTAQLLSKHAAGLYDHGGQRIWQFSGPSRNMYLVEQEELFRGIRQNRPINNGAYMCNSTMMAIMGRMAAYSGRTLTWDECMQSSDRLGPSAYTWSDSVPDSHVAVPGKSAPT